MKKNSTISSLQRIHGALILFLCLSALRARAQSDALSSVQSNADTWEHQVLHEKLFVHCDKSFYLAGEILWCRLYCVDANTHRPLGISKIAYVEVLDRDNKPVMQGKIALENGFGEGAFTIPPSATSGSYLLRAYTSWMKNFGPETFFAQPVTIVNTITGIDTAAITRPDSTQPYTLGFFPEGGDLIAGLPGYLAFEMTTDQGQAIDAPGAILSATGDTIATFRPQQQGMGIFPFTPGSGQPYKAILHCPDGILRSWPVPPILAQGYTLHLRDDGQTLTLVVHASPGLALQNTRLFLHAADASSFIPQMATGAGDSASFTIPRGTLRDGNNRFTLFDAAGRPRAERQFFVPPHNRLSLTAATDQSAYTTRQKVKLDIALTDTANAHLSVSVYRLDSLQGYPSTDIVRYLWQSSEWSGALPSMESLDDPALAGLYSLTHGWTRFRWPDILSHPYGPRLYPPEIHGQIITGRLSDPHSGASAKNIVTFLSAPGPAFQFAATQTDTGGRFRFDIKDFYGQDGIVIHTNTGATGYKVDAFSPFSEQYTGYQLPAFRLSREQLRWLNRHNVGMQVQNIFAGDSLRHFDLPRVDTTPFFGANGYTYWMDNYVRFTTIEEVLREYVREINVLRSHGHPKLVMIDQPAHSVFRDGNTLVLLDGVPVPDDRIFNYDPNKVKKLQVIPREYILGPSHFSGIASFTTYRGDFEGLEIDSNSLQIEYEGMQYHRQFYSPAYASIRQIQSRLPDFRNVLYWNPDVPIKTSARVEFYTSDLPGDYLIVIQGLSPAGHAGVTYQKFTVRYHPIP
jgi:hypothetical protein